MCSNCGQSCGEILEYKVVDNSLLPIVVQKGLDNPKGYHPRCRDGRLPCRLATVCASFKPKKKELTDKVKIPTVIVGKSLVTPYGVVPLHKSV